ncbi:MAG TPA: hypothetical protein H9972_11670 [Candidatus Paraprevotella stercorigallinarum]|jgi:hypothetical protein|nr:hypothetical protein [Candidatus Paraprevotella stercorigallinarum]
MKRIKCFIAGSKDQERQREILTSVLGNMQSKWDVIFEAKSFMDFNGTLSPDGQQKDYNKYILSKADLVVFVFDHKVGDKTIEEFSVAYKGLLSNSHPDILVFCNSSLMSDANIIALNLMMRQLNQYYIEYLDDKELKKLFSDEIDKYIRCRKERSVSKWVLDVFLNSNRYRKIKNQLLVILSVLVFFSIIYIGATSNLLVSNDDGKNAVTTEHSIYDNRKIVQSKTIKTTNNIIRIEKFADNLYRYLSWNISKGIDGKKEPSLIIDYGEYKDGFYRFKKGAYIYSVPDDDEKQVSVEVNGTVIGKEEIVDSDYDGEIVQAQNI